MFKEGTFKNAELLGRVQIKHSKRAVLSTRYKQILLEESNELDQSNGSEHSRKTNKWIRARKNSEEIDMDGGLKTCGIKAKHQHSSTALRSVMRRCDEFRNKK